MKRVVAFVLLFGIFFSMTGCVKTIEQKVDTKPVDASGNFPGEPVGETDNEEGPSSTQAKTTEATQIDLTETDHETTEMTATEPVASVPMETEPATTVPSETVHTVSPPVHDGGNWGGGEVGL